MSLPLHLLAALVLVGLPAAAWPAPPLTPEWSFDVLKLKNGVVHKGVLLDEGPAEVKFQIVRRAPGRPTVKLTLKFAKVEITQLDKLSDEERATLKAKLEDIDSSPEAEARRLDKLDLKVIDWSGKKANGLRFDSDYFSLQSDAPEEIVRRAAYLLENVYAAYVRFLPPRFPGGAPTVILVHRSLAGYQKAVPGGEAIRNPAFYEPSANRVVCGTDLQKLGDDLARFREDADQALDDLKKQEVEVIRLYGKKPELARHLQPIKDCRTRIGQVAKANEAAFERATRQLFQTLFHEAFHAYVGQFVYPSAAKDGAKPPGELPRWLNEGMAQAFETAVFEAGELRVGHADRARLEKAQDSLARKDFPLLKDVLTAGPKVFVVTHAGQRPEADRAYVATWALASYLMFDRRVLGTAGLDDFVKAVSNGEDARAAFEKLVGQPADEFEKAFHGWLRRLLPNGTLLETGPGK
jgi:Protein of unknown function (DUF1570)